MRLHTIAFKMLKDLFSVRRTLLFLIAVTVVPFFGSLMFASQSQASQMTLAMHNQMTMGFFVIMSFIWISGIPLVLLAGVTCGDFISKEEQDGTLLLLISKPVRRHEIILGKFLAFMLSALILELTALLLSTALIAACTGIDIYIFNNMLGMVPYLYLYSIFVAFIFGALSTALTSMFRSRIKNIMTIFAITILIFFGFMVMRGWLEAAGVYQEYGLMYADINYHLGNSFLFFTQSSGLRMMPTIQGILGQFTGTYGAADIWRLYDRDTGALPPTLEAKNICTPLVSMLIWICLAVALLFAGILKFNRKEIS